MIIPIGFSADGSPLPEGTLVSLGVVAEMTGEAVARSLRSDWGEPCGVAISLDASEMD